MSWQELHHDGHVVLRPSPSEAARFGVSVDRVAVPDRSGSSHDDVLDVLGASEADVVVLRYPARHVDLFAWLLGCGRDAIFADTLAYWRLRTGSGRRPEPTDGLEAAVGVSVDDAVVDELVGEIFRNYGNHYLADPLFDPEAALAGYQEWARRSAADAGAVVLRDGTTDIALATTSTGANVLEIELAGVRAAFQGRGFYGHLLAAVEDLAGSAGVREVVISTQGHNANVQRAWTRYGFEPVVTFATVHLVKAGLLRR